MSRRGALRLSLLAALAVVGVASGCDGIGAAGSGAHLSGTSSTRFSGQPVLADASATDFTLRDQGGTPVRLSALKGHVVVLTFLYTNCRDVCPLIAEHLNDVLHGLGPSRGGVRVLAVSVDPARDTRVAVRAYVRVHRLLPEFRFLVGSLAQLRPVWQAYNVLAMPRNETTVDHTAPTLLLDRSGTPRVYYASNFRATDVLADVRRLLAAL